MADAAETMSQVMVEGVTTKLTAGALADAIATADRYIAGFDTRNAQVMQTFGTTLASLHLLRGAARRAQALEASDETALVGAEDDLRRGVALMQQHGDGQDAAQMESLVEGIRGVNGGGAQVVTAFVERARTLRSSRAARPSGAAALSLPDGRRLARLAGWTLLGGALWAASISLFLWVSRASGNTFFLLLGVAPFYLLLYAGLRGWRWFSQYSLNTLGGMVKCLAFLVLGVSLIGTLPVAYWTGKGVWETFGGPSDL